MTLQPSSSPSSPTTGPEVAHTTPPTKTERALQNPQMAKEVWNTIKETRRDIGNLAHQVSPNAAPNFLGTALPAVALLGTLAITWNALNMVVSGKQRGIITGREKKLV